MKLQPPETDPRVAYMAAQLRLFRSVLGYGEDGACVAWNLGARVTWPGRWIRLAHPAFAPTFPGVYALCDGSRVLYIGESRNVARRLTNHLLNWSDGGGTFAKSKTRVNVRVRMNLDVRSGEHELLELRLIQRLRPPFNIRHNPNALPAPADRLPARPVAAQEGGR